MHGSLENVKQRLTMQLFSGNLSGSKFIWCKECWLNIQIHGNLIKNQVFLRNELSVYPFTLYYTWYQLYPETHSEKCGTIMFLCINALLIFDLIWLNKSEYYTSYLFIICCLFISVLAPATPKILIFWHVTGVCMLQWHLMYTCTK